jgi:hypothetical protein
MACRIEEIESRANRLRIIAITNRFKDVRAHSLGGIKQCRAAGLQRRRDLCVNRDSVADAIDKQQA